ncbi:MAG: serine protease [Ruminococcaceae bacterium]|nr:serine protease [Oscillospiraceae bacterium]
MEKLEYKLDVFEGPLDLLLYLISKNKLNINDIQLSVLVDQYVEHIRLMQSEDMDIASEFLEMASRLIYLKTVSLLPKHEEAEQIKEELTAELMEYEHCRKVAKVLSTMTDDFDTFIKAPEKIEYDKTYRNVHEPELILKSYFAAVGRGQRRLPPPTTVFSKIVARKIVSVSSKIVSVLKNLRRHGNKRMRSLFEGAKSRSELVATFLAVLELCKANRVWLDGDGEEITVSVKESK